MDMEWYEEKQININKSKSTKSNLNVGSQC